jgi:hypothetical protein
VTAEIFVEGDDRIARGGRIGVDRGGEKAPEELVEMAVFPFEDRRQRRIGHDASYCLRRKKKPKWGRMSRMRQARAAGFGLAFLLALGSAACARSGDPVRESLDAMVKAANARDAGALFDHVAPNFEAADGSSLADAKANVGRYFAAYEILDVSIRDVQVERGEGAARVRLRAQMSGQPRKIGGLEGIIPSSAAYDFDLRLVADNGKWKVAWAQWGPAS